MSRRKKPRGLPSWILPVLIALFGLGGYLIFSQGGKEGTLRTVEELDPSLYYGNANSLRGNTYRIDAEIDSALGNSRGKGRLFSMTLKNAAKGGAPVILPAPIPPTLGSLTIQKGQPLPHEGQGGRQRPAQR